MKTRFWILGGASLAGVLIVAAAVAVLVVYFVGFAPKDTVMAKPEVTETSAEATVLPSEVPPTLSPTPALPPTPEVHSIGAPPGEPPEVGVDQGIRWEVLTVTVQEGGAITGLEFRTMGYWNPNVAFLATGYPLEEYSCVPRLTKLQPVEEGVREIGLLMDVDFCGKSLSWTFTQSMLPEDAALSREVVAVCFVQVWEGKPFFAGDCSGDNVVIVQP